MGIDLKGQILQRAVFLDRDGVINEAITRDGKPYPPGGIHETIIVADAPGSMARLKERGFLLIVITNQPDVRRGTVTHEAVEGIHGFLSSNLPLDDFFVCYHDDRDGCDCRKPLPGLLTRAAAKHQIDVKQSYLIGDRWRDIEAGGAAGCRTVLIDYHYNEKAATHTPDAIVASLSEAVDWILKQEFEN
jgi:D-glycero-D-manno-heptose 1,7-bisphosphate phosphatase